MGLVKTADEVARIQSVLRQPRFVAAEMLSIDFLTHPETVAAVLPPGLEPAAEPLMTAMVGRWRSNCVGDYCGGAIYVLARYREIEAFYVLAMYMDTDAAIMFGRDVFGEPKKRAESNLQRRGHSMQGTVDRNGTRLIDIRAELDEDLGPATVSGANFNIKATPAADGSGCESDPALTLAEFDNTLTVRRAGSGRLALGTSLHDPLGDIDTVSLRGASYVEGDLIARARTIGYLPKEAYFPYLLGRMDDWSALDTEHLLSLSRV
jgi:acetoacetate decarboxylase